jgi:hypothetical protein
MAVLHIARLVLFWRTRLPFICPSSALARARVLLVEVIRVSPFQRAITPVERFEPLSREGSNCFPMADYLANNRYNRNNAQSGARIQTPTPT